MILSFITAAPVFAEGIGLGWEDGLSGRFPASNVIIQGILHFTDISGDENSGNTDGSTFALSGYVAYPILKIERSKLNFFGGFGIQSIPDRDMNVGFRFGVEPTVMVTDHVGVSGKLGIQFISIGGADDVDNSGGSTFGLWGITSIHWYF